MFRLRNAALVVLVLVLAAPPGSAAEEPFRFPDRSTIMIDSFLGAR